MTHQFDMMLGDLDPAVLERATEKLPKAREVTEPRLPLDACMHPVNVLKAIAASAGTEVPLEHEAWMRAVCDEEVTYEPVLDSRAREDHR